MAWILLTAGVLFVNTRLEAASELQKRDSAFSLLIVAFRQTQDALIENDYRARLQAANAIEDINSKQHVLELARHERNLRLDKLNSQLAKLVITYDYSRQRDAREMGDASGENIDAGVATQQLRRFVVIPVSP